MVAASEAAAALEATVVFRILADRLLEEAVVPEDPSLGVVAAVVAADTPLPMKIPSTRILLCTLEDSILASVR